MKFTAALASLVSLAAAAPSGVAPTPLDVQLQKVGNSLVKAVITNNGASDLKVYRPGSIFDSLPTEKVKIIGADGSEVPFKGIRASFLTTGLTEDYFQHIPAGKSVEVTWDVAQTHDLSQGGDFNMLSEGVLQFAKVFDQKLVGSMPYSSNSLSSVIDGIAAGKAHQNLLPKRTTLQNDCTGERGQAQATANRNCASLASAGYNAATSAPDSKLQEFFKDASQNTRNQVAQIYSRVYDECSNTPGGSSRTFCTDIGNNCGQGVLAYTYISQHDQVYCDLHFTTPAVGSCHQMDQVSISLNHWL